ncbi:MAG: hypothetical protein ACD_42C00518G0002 [uncultured bacterium]|nr:MAG: hypothetical protein ACD_42C00518G0002 [uncultured bacterium]OGT25988.1 MAG: hypothetical protein A3B71_08075 [Gammaproteobacteria bacterium RIFCSPHIGHO2_02_FULL_42_43]OGT27419.1 MAG: hypothetical protein A2624_06765 [Gammaproteobacteria bacterium RIFCSPHIGHO2_01_FULL_42_8]OGT52372.1 MAG: hypothetical protein A3E54_01950 [Gammaproteobacteria bacterium RIFCSPHIGHO2_12_FULL_41_25]OGT63337.1 MAG: hypothetical protein A3I77_02740 [Gammaproteobacteria bacterium RIFCSPLOWO2_02_FULL_42_14]OGT
MPEWTLSFVIAHRGAPQLAPENTIAALKAAAVAGAASVECDVQLTRDHALVILHDETLDRTTKLKGLLSQTTLQEIKEKDASVPTLDEWLRVAALLSLSLNLELKTQSNKQAVILANGLIAALALHWPTDFPNPVISSTSLYVLTEVKKCNAALPIAWIVEKKLSERKLHELKKLGVISVHQPYQLMNDAYIQQCHAAGLRVLTYTVNQKEEAEKLQKMGIDGIFTDNMQLCGN